MKNSRIFAALFFAAAFAFIAVPSARAQLDTSAPIVVKETHPNPVWLKAEVIRADGNRIVVREQADAMHVHTFTYSAKAVDEMQQVLDSGGYQTGDKVKILYQPGDTIALDIRGRPSKPN